MNPIASAIRQFIPASLGRLVEGRFTKQVMLLTSGTVVAQGLTVLAAPLLTRLYSPSDFGLLASFTVCLSMAVIFVSLKYEQAIPAVKKDSEAASLFTLTLLIAFIQTVFLGLALILGYRYVPEGWLPALDVEYSWILGLAIFLHVAYQAATYAFIRNRKFSLIASVGVKLSAVKIVSQVLFGLIALKTTGLMLGIVLGQACATILLIKALWEANKLELKGVTLAKMMLVAERNRNFPLFVMPSLMLNSLSGIMPLLIIPVLFGKESVGVFLVAIGLTMKPMSLMGQSVSQAFYGEISSPNQVASSNLRLFLKLSGCLLLMGILGAAVLSSAPMWVGYVLGDDWKHTGWVFVALSPLLLTRLVASPLSHAHHLRKTQSLFLVIEAFRLSLTCAGFYIGYSYDLKFEETVAVYSVVTSITYGVHWVSIYRILKSNCYNRESDGSINLDRVAA